MRTVLMLLAFAALLAFSVLLARLTLEPSAASEGLIHSNLRPGSSIRAYIDRGTVREAARQLGGNLLLGVPFGVLLPVLLPRARGAVRVVVATAAVMTLVELVQGALVTGRTFDIDDVILNTSGALLGYLLLGRRLGRVVHPRRRHWWHRWYPRPDGSADAAAGADAREKAEVDAIEREQERKGAGEGEEERAAARPLRRHGPRRVRRS
ncbi:VanZ family protein [Streptomyces sp. NPDC059917]|uniref:VanZ family protein n=1 Tax=Streptomyces sp. NPDC059917 TaxID=3347002 RepID=UPI00364734D7